MFRKTILSIVATLFALCSLLVFVGVMALFLPFAALAGVALLLLYFSISIFDSATGWLNLKKELEDVRDEREKKDANSQVYRSW